MFVHGHWYYRRLSALVLYSFYKNIASFTCQFFFAIHSNWSGISMYDDLYLIMFNALYTNFPIIVYGLCEQNLSEETLLSRPELYRRNRHNRSMRFRELSKWVMLGFWHSAVCFYFTYFLWQPSFGQFGDDLRAFGSVVGFNVVLVANLKLVLSSRFSVIVGGKTCVELTLRLLAVTGRPIFSSRSASPSSPTFSASCCFSSGTSWTARSSRTPTPSARGRTPSPTSPPGRSFPSSR